MFDAIETLMRNCRRDCPQFIDEGIGEFSCSVNFKPAECLNYDPDEYRRDALDDVLEAVVNEIDRARELYPENNAEDVGELEFGVILAREVGEVAETMWKGGKPGKHSQYEELVQVAAVSIMRAVGIAKRGE